MKITRAQIFFIPLFILLVLPIVVFAHSPADVAPDETPQSAEGATPPTILVTEDVQRLTVQGAKVWWWYTLPCAPTAARQTGAFRVEEVGRVPATGGLIRNVFVQDVGSPYCGDWSPELLSNVAADEDYLYWMSNQEDGLARLSVEANPGDPATLVYGGQTNAEEIEERGDYVFLLHSSYGIIRVDKETAAETPLITGPQLDNGGDMQVSNDKVFYNRSGGALTWVSINGGVGDGITMGNVTSYIAENSLCAPDDSCNSTDYVFVGLADEIRRYDVTDDTFSSPLYTSPVSDGTIVEMTVDKDNIYFFERREATCEPFCTYDYGLYRMDRTGGTADLLYSLTGQIFGGQIFDLTVGGPGKNYLFWQDNGQVKRLPRDAAAIPSIDVFITDIEVTQSIQDLNNSVDLIREKRTGVRVHVDAAGQNVPGIPAELYRINSEGTIIDGPISPSSGTNYLTVPNNPSRSNFDHAFYFELPGNWIDDSTLRLRAEINPNKIPPEPNYTNNVQTTQTFTMQASPTLRTHLIVWGYTVDGNYYQPGTVQDVWQARSWIRRVYPLASNTGGYSSPDPGFRLKIRTINDPNLGAHVERTSDFCLDIPEEDREFCAATYTNNCAKWLRATEGIPEGELMYSMIWDEPSLPFPRGFATGGVSSGPTGTGTWGWDNDGSYGDWYMGHEVGHNVGRGHPSQGNFCGHSASDPNYPYANAAIGTGDMWGFDVGDIGLNSSLDPRVYPNSQWRDMMSYCDRQWISDYTYEGIYDFLTTLNASARSTTPRPVRAGGDYLALFGTVYDASDTAAFQVVGTWDSPGPYGAPDGGPYQMRLLDGGGSELAAYDFDGEADDANPDNYGFEVVVPFPPGTMQIELVRKSDSAVLATHTLSANPPTISNVELVGATSPVSGTVTLQWQASDPDGDDLTYDVYYTDDDGASYTAYALALPTKSVELDTTQMGGSTQARFRVTANDGTRMAEAESATFTMANKPPIVTILTPQDGLEVTYGTQVSFVAEVEDLQGHIPDGNMQWYVNGNPTLVAGPAYTAYLLPVGENEISLQATNGAAQTTETSVTVIVNDDVAYPGPTLAVGPDQLGWQVDEGTTTPQQRTLTISNIGTGELAWTASEEVNWLSLSTSSGDAPGTLTVTADPTKVAPGVPADTVITISGDNGQSVEIPVSLLVGVTPVWGPNPDFLYGVFLPVSLRQ